MIPPEKTICKFLLFFTEELDTTSRVDQLILVFG